MEKKIKKKLFCSEAFAVETNENIILLFFFWGRTKLEYVFKECPKKQNTWETDKSWDMHFIWARTVLLYQELISEQGWRLKAKIKLNLIQVFYSTSVLLFFNLNPSLKLYSLGIFFQYLIGDKTAIDAVAYKYCWAMKNCPVDTIVVICLFVSVPLYRYSKRGQTWLFHCIKL